MRACLGILDLPIEKQLLNEVIQLTNGDSMPIPSGMLTIFSQERYSLTFDRLFRIMADNKIHRYILTVGDFNDSPRPQFYDLYSKFAISVLHSPGDVLVCAQTFAKAGSAIKLYPIVDYQPLSLGWLANMKLVATRFGNVEESALWYTSQNVNLVAPHEPMEFMTRGSEMDFWYSPAGFLYLAHQAMIIRAYRAKPRRVLVFTRKDLNSQRFLKLIFLFEALGIETYLVYEEDMNTFNQAGGISDVQIFSRAGHYSFLKIGGTLFLSDQSSVASTISTAQSDLIHMRGVHKSVEAYMTAYQNVLDNPDKASWRRRARTARGLLDRFISYPPPTQRAVLETFVERWRTL